MIQIHYKGRLGNRLFQYALGRLLAESLGYELQAEPIIGFAGTYDTITGRRFADPRDPVQELRAFQVDIPSVIGDTSGRRIVVSGYFERREYFTLHRERIQRWFAPSDEIAPCPYNISADDLVIQVRRGDFLYYNSLLPFSFFEEALARARFSQLYICSDDFEDPFIRKFQKYSPILVKASPLEQFFWSTAFNKMVVSQSTFSWWSAFLSNAAEIYQPIPLEGFWCRETAPYRDLIVDDDPRYLRIRCVDTYRPTIRESLKILRWRATEHLNDYRRPVAAILKARAGENA